MFIFEEPEKWFLGTLASAREFHARCVKFSRRTGFQPVAGFFLAEPRRKKSPVSNWQRTAEKIPCRSPQLSNVKKREGGGLESRRDS